MHGRRAKTTVRREAKASLSSHITWGEFTVHVLLVVDPHLRLSHVDVELRIVALTRVEENSGLVASAVRERRKRAGAHQEIGPVRSCIPGEAIARSSEIPLSLGF